MSNNTENNGISILIDTFNDGNFNLIIDFHKPNEDTCKAFAIVLSMIERGKIYEFILDKIKEIHNKNNQDLNKLIEIIFDTKKIIDENLDIPAVLPRDVFKRISAGV